MSVDTARSPAISVIVPVRNEAENIAPLVAESERVGGSRAQHDLIEFTLLSACLGANRLDKARDLLAARRPGAAGVPVAGVAAIR